MKILRPTSFMSYCDKGSSTKPWVVKLLEENGIERPYVVKMFAPHHIEQQHPVFKEIICNVLATELGLNVPAYGITHFDDFFIKNVLNDEQREIYSKKHKGWLFASRLQDGMSPYSKAIPRTILRYEDYASIFAFDCVVYNLDRGKNPLKPNLLVEDDNYLLIDHEQTFPFIDNLDNLFHKIVKDLGNNRLDYNYQSHIFYELLKSVRLRNKKDLFNEFHTSFKNLNLDKIEEAVDIIESFNISSGNKHTFIEYLYTIKNNINQLCLLLTSIIS